MSIGDGITFTSSNYAPCGCWIGPWMSVDLPPRCQIHSEPRPSGWYHPPRTLPSTPSPFAGGAIPDYGSSVVTVTTTAATPDSLANSAYTIEQLVDELRNRLLGFIGAARKVGDATLIDVWTQAYDALNHMSVQIAVAREAEKAK